MNPPRLAVRLSVAAAVAAGGVAYAVHAVSVDREIRAGAAAYAELCDRVTANAAATGSPGTVAHLAAALQLELARLREAYPRWYASYRADPSRYPCGPSEPNTQVGSDR